MPKRLAVASQMVSRDNIVRRILASPLSLSFRRFFSRAETSRLPRSPVNSYERAGEAPYETPNENPDRFARDRRSENRMNVAN